jgi:hypothetical protein
VSIVQVKQEQPESALAAAAAADGMQIDGAAQQQQQDVKPPPDGVQEAGECLLLLPSFADGSSISADRSAFYG